MRNRRKKASFSRFLPDGTVMAMDSFSIPLVTHTKCFFSFSLILGMRLGTELFIVTKRRFAFQTVKLGVASSSKRFFSAQERWRKNEDNFQADEIKIATEFNLQTWSHLLIYSEEWSSYESRIKVFKIYLLFEDGLHLKAVRVIVNRRCCA